ncbi:hypothetical protein [Streptomyces sp. NBC_00439]|uniref:hypothetical protein n=1 Tax=Streptomyces sp. NBC_00439 TaxID=2903650 RepID=UPI00224DA2FB|nr:hypothetical protein [Streptomyces sp. NBC_00439]MCX5106942.1 hypothetical protein [Streptomyces sp. NBC_00439]
MNTVNSFVLAGKLGDLGDGWIGMLGDWGAKGLKAGLVCLVVVVMVQKFSLKAGIGALLLMALALGLYNARNDLAAIFEDEVKNPSQGAPAVPGLVPGTGPLAGSHPGNVGEQL